MNFASKETFKPWGHSSYFYSTMPYMPRVREKKNSKHRKPHFYYGVTSLKTLSSVKCIWRADLTKLLEHKCSWRGWFHSKLWKYIWLPQQLSFSWDGASNFQNKTGNTPMNNWGYLIIFFVRVGSHVWSQRALVRCSDVQITRQQKKKKESEHYLVWYLTNLIFRRDFKRVLCLFHLPILEVVYGTRLFTWARVAAHLPIHTWGIQMTTAQSSKKRGEPDKLQPLSLWCGSIILVSLIPSLLFCLRIFPPVLAHGTHKFSPFSSAWAYQANNFSFNEHVVFSCAARSPNTPSQPWQLSGKGGCDCVRLRVRGWNGREV